MAESYPSKQSAEGAKAASGLLIVMTTERVVPQLINGIKMRRLKATGRKASTSRRKICKMKSTAKTSMKKKWARQNTRASRVRT